MNSRLLLLVVSIGIIFLNLLTVKYRSRTAGKLEKKLRELAENKKRGLTLNEISAELNIPLYDAKILTRKFITQGKVKVKHLGGVEMFVFKS
jgi:hypothetical protein